MTSNLNARPNQDPTSVNLDDELISFLEDDEISPSQTLLNPWKLLITDDDQTVHDSTVLALHSITIHGRPIELIHAHSAAEARNQLLANPDTALILLDVVMETMNAGFLLVEAIRNELKLPNLRIVIRSGQPGVDESTHESYRTYVDCFTVKSKITRSTLIDVLEEMLAPDIKI